MITKHPGTGGRLTVDTVTAQLLYEIQTPSYANPDVVTRFDTIRARPRSAPTGCGSAACAASRRRPTAKVAINYEGGFRNKMTFVLTGLDQERKAAWAGDALVTAMGGADRLREAGVTMERRFVPAPSDGADQERSSGLLHVHVKAPDERAVGPGVLVGRRRAGPRQLPRVLHDQPAGAGVVVRRVLAGARAGRRDRPGRRARGRHADRASSRRRPARRRPSRSCRRRSTPRRRRSPPGTPLGAHFGARSGDKGGNANVGIWARDDAGYAWLAAQPDDRTRSAPLIPEAADRPIHRYELPNLRALNFVLVGYLGEGVASSTAFDPQAKGLGEYLRSRLA